VQNTREKGRGARGAEAEGNREAGGGMGEYGRKDWTRVEREGVGEVKSDASGGYRARGGGRDAVEERMGEESKEG